MKIVAFDTETTGLLLPSVVPPERQPRLIELAVQEVGSEAGQSWLLNPGIPIPLESSRVHEIKDADVKGCPELPAVAEQIRGRLQKADVVVAHNASFDVGVIDVNFARCALDPIIWPRVVCTVEATQHLFGHRLNLAKLHDHLGLGEFRAHRAASDVAALARIIEALGDELGISPD